MLTLSLLQMNPECLSLLLSLLKLVLLLVSYKHRLELKLKSVKLRKIPSNSWKLQWTPALNTYRPLRKRAPKTK